MPIHHTFMPIITVVSDDDGGNPRIVEADWSGAHYCSTAADGTILAERGDGSADGTTQACALLDDPTTRARVAVALGLDPQEA
jgi:hypothetical protein